MSYFEDEISTAKEDLARAQLRLLRAQNSMVQGDVVSVRAETDELIRAILSLRDIGCQDLGAVHRFLKLRPCLAVSEQHQDGPLITLSLRPSAVLCGFLETARQKLAREVIKVEFTPTAEDFAEMEAGRLAQRLAFDLKLAWLPGGGVRLTQDNPPATITIRRAEHVGYLLSELLAPSEDGEGIHFIDFDRSEDGLTEQSQKSDSGLSIFVEAPRRDDTLCFSVTEGNPCFGVEFQAARAAPGRERLRIDVCLDHKEAAVDLTPSALLGRVLPLIERAREFVAVVEDAQ